MTRGIDIYRGGQKTVQCSVQYCTVAFLSIEQNYRQNCYVGDLHSAARRTSASIGARAEASRSSGERNRAEEAAAFSCRAIVPPLAHRDRCTISCAM